MKIISNVQIDKFLKIIQRLDFIITKEKHKTNIIFFFRLWSFDYRP